MYNNLELNGLVTLGGGSYPAFLQK